MSVRCERCGRTTARRHETCPTAPAITHAYVTHDYYGCDSQCCGHTLYGLDVAGAVVFSKFDFTHPYVEGMERREEWITEFIRDDPSTREAVILFEKCEVTNDC